MQNVPFRLLINVSIFNISKLRVPWHYIDNWVYGLYKS
jgi:hypothetical protein